MRVRLVDAPVKNGKGRHYWAEYTFHGRTLRTASYKTPEEVVDRIEGDFTIEWEHETVN